MNSASYTLLRHNVRTWIHRNGFMGRRNQQKNSFNICKKVKVPEGLARIAGGFGHVVLILVYFTIARGKVLVQRIESVTLSHGGGPPNMTGRQSK